MHITYENMKFETYIKCNIDWNITNKTTSGRAKNGPHLWDGLIIEVIFI